MSATKGFLFYVVSLFLIFNAVVLYFVNADGILKFSQITNEIIYKFVGTSVTMMIILILVTISFGSIKRSIKKNTLRIALIMSFVMIVASIVQRIMDEYILSLFIWKVTQTVGYIALFFIILAIAKELYGILTEQVERNKIQK